MVVIRENERENLEWLEKANLECPEELKIKGQHLKSWITDELPNVKWRLDKESVEEWCNKKGVSLHYFETKEEHEAWLEVLKYDTILTTTVSELEEEVEELKRRIEEAKEENETEKFYLLMKELELIGCSLPE